MKNAILYISAVLLLFSCEKEIKSIYVKDMEELELAIDQAAPGDDVVLKKGVRQDV